MLQRKFEIAIENEDNNLQTVLSMELEVHIRTNWAHSGCGFDSEWGSAEFVGVRVAFNVNESCALFPYVRVRLNRVKRTTASRISCAPRQHMYTYVAQCDI